MSGRELERLYGEWTRAWLDRDPATVDRLMAEEYRYAAPDGRVYDRAAILGIVRSPSYRLDWGERSEVSVAPLCADSAVILSRWRGEGGYEGRTFRDDHRCTTVFARRGGAWRIVHEHCSGAPAPDPAWRTATWRQFGAAIDMLGNAIRDCPEGLWADRSRRPEPWYLAYHTLFWLDLYLGGAVEGFAPPAPFGLEELDPSGVLPGRPYTRAELGAYLEHCRAKCRATVGSLTDEGARRTCRFGWGEASFAELLLYNLRHVQHGAAQLNLLLRQAVDAAPRWVARGKE